MATGTRPIKASSPGPVLEYLQDADTTLGYYSDGQGFDRAWGGLARELGVSNGITREQWIDAFYGRWDGKQMVRKTENRVPLQDVTLSTPKSVAELFVVADDKLREQLTQAMWAACEEAFNYLEKTTLAARVRSKVMAGDGSVESVQRRYPAKMLCTPVLQYSARPTEQTEERGAPADPSVHCHLAIMSWVRVGDRDYTSDNWGFKVNAEHVDQVFMSELARQIENLGIELEYPEFDRARNGKVLWEVAGSRKETREFWSSNTERMWGIKRAFEEEFGKPIDETELRRRMHLSKKGKSQEDKVQDSRPNWDRWRDDAREQGVKLLEIDRRQIRHDAFKEADRLRDRLNGPQGFCRDGAILDEPTIGQSIRRCAVGLGFSQQELDGLEHILLSGQSKDLVPVRDAVEPENRLYTTQAMLDAEQRIAKTREQKADRWVDVTGPAGCGKSRSLGVAVEVVRSLPVPEQPPERNWCTTTLANCDQNSRGCRNVELNAGQQRAVDAMVRAGGKPDQVIVVSMAATTAESTGRRVKADSWGSVDSVLARIERKTIKPTDRTLIVVEEAGQLGTLQADRLLKAVGNARVVTLSDLSQLSAISASGWLADSLSRHGSVELTEVRRQADEQDVKAYDLIRRGRAHEALQDLADRGRVHAAADDAERMAAMQAKYRELRDAGAPSRHVRMVMDSSNVDVDTANRFIQRYRLEHGEIGTQAVTVDAVERRWQVHDNDEVIMLQTTRVRGEDPIKNGKTGKIMHIDERMNVARIRFDDGREAVLPISGAIGLSYAVHIQKYQGNECEFALYAPGRGQMSRNSAYTALSRGIIESHVFASVESHKDIHTLGTMMQRIDEKVSATKTLAELRAQELVRELPAVRSDELVHDVAMPPIDPNVDMSERFLDQRLLQDLPEQVLIEPTLDQSLEHDFGQSM